ncbi:hypothetical protein BKA69DRAFT_1126355 [Paraphysoderma sedebokerense]|nr:hypothetical protein BKA69DRAFT_1126355 [Paraphysoderma sedebokerense]
MYSITAILSLLVLLSSSLPSILSTPIVKQEQSIPGTQPLQHFIYNFNSRSYVSAGSTFAVGSSVDSKHTKLTKRSNDVLEFRAGKFYIKFDCGHAGFTLCRKMKEALEKAGKGWSSVLHLSQEITVDVAYTTFDGTFHAETRAMALWTGEGREADKAFSYPQALAKQIPSFYSAIKERISTDDITLRLNSRMASKWSFAADGHRIDSDMLDFEYIAYHEFAHGLAIVTSWSNHLSNLDAFSSSQGGLFTTTPLVSNSEITGFLPPTIFDKYLFVNMEQTYLREYYSAISSGILKDARSKTSSSPGWKYARKLWDYVDNGEEGMMAFVTQSGVKLDLYAGPTFKSGTSLIHFPRKSCKSDDSIACPVSTDVKGINFSDSNGAPIGSRVLEIMKTVGYRDR